MRTIIVAAGIWVLLFAGTVLTRHLLREPSAHKTAAVQNAADLPDNGMAKLKSLPRTTQEKMIELDDVMSAAEYPEFLSSLHEALSAEPATEQLRRCKTFMRRSNRAREFVEFSFETRDEIDASSHTLRTRLYDVAIERSSIELSQAEAVCLRSALEGLAVGSPQALFGRMASAMCFRRL